MRAGDLVAGVDEGGEGEDVRRHLQLLNSLIQQHGSVEQAALGAGRQHCVVRHQAGIKPAIGICTPASTLPNALCQVQRTKSRPEQTRQAGHDHITLAVWASKLMAGCHSLLLAITLQADPASVDCSTALI